MVKDYLGSGVVRMTNSAAGFDDDYFGVSRDLQSDRKAVAGRQRKYSSYKFR